VQTTRRCNFYLILFFSLFVIHAQNGNKKWYFGNGTGLNFLTVPPSTLAGSSMSTPEGCASIADGSGNLLFYTNGVTVWDRNHATMANGTGLLGHNSTSQSCLIIPLPGSSTLYYIFTNVGNNILNVPNLNYSIVDISLSAGNGSVTTKNAVLSADPQTEMLSATRHCNGIDWWIVSHMRSTNCFLTFLLTSTGITGNTVASFAGPTLLSGFSQMKVSPNGRKLAMNVGGLVYLGEFDNATGQTYGFNTIQNSTLGYGCEFSPDGGKLYTSAANGIFQFNLCAGSLPAILSSSISVHAQNAAFGSFQLATNDKIYITYNTTTTSCHVINSPNSTGAACGFATGVHQFLPTSISAGLPNFPGCYFYKKVVPNPFFVSVSSSYGCYGAMFDATILSGTCTAITNSVSGYTWDFGDPLSGANNVAYTANTVHNFSGNGTFTVTLYVYYACGVGTDTIRQPVIINDQCLTYTNSAATCASLGSATLTGASGVGPFTYTWLPSNQTGTLASALTPGNHTVVVRDAWANYTYSVPIFLAPSSLLSASISLLTNPTCFGGNNATATITGIAGGSGNQSYLWTNGILTFTQQNPSNLTAGNWSVTVTDALTACKVNSVLPITQPLPVSPLLSATSPTACCTDSIVLTCSVSGGNPAYSCSWNPGITSSSCTVSESIAGPHVYSVTVWDSNNCTGTQSISVSFISSPSVSVSNASVCPGSAATLQASGATSYTWLAPASPSSTGATFSAAPLSNSSYTLLGSAAGCTAVTNASIILFSLPNPIIQHNAPQCDGSNFIFSASGAVSYSWSGPGNYLSSANSNTIQSIALLNSGLYSVTAVSAQGCIGGNSATLLVTALPAVAATGGTICNTQTVQLTAASVAGALYYWVGPSGYYTNSQNPTLQNPPITSSGIYTVIATSPAGCTNSAVADLQIISPPTINLSLSNYSICNFPYSGSVNTLTINASGAASYTFSASNQFSVSSSSSQFYLQPIAFLGAIGNTYTALIAGTNGVCSAIKNFTFIVISNPLLTLISNTPAICIGESVTLTASGATNYFWSPGSSAGQISNNGATLISSPQTNASYSLIGSDKGCFSQQIPISINVKTLPSFSVSPTGTSICLNNRVLLNADGFGCTFTWLPSSGLNTSSGTQVLAQPTADQIYTIVALNNGCAKSKTISITVLPLPIPLISVQKNKVCVTDSIILTGSGGIEQYWYGPGGTSGRGSRVFFLPQPLNSFQTFTLLVLGTNACANSTVQTIEIMKLPEGDFDFVPQSICLPHCANFNFKTYSKNTAVDFVIEGKKFSGIDFNYCFQNTGAIPIYCQLRDAATSCSSSLQYTVNAFPKPVADFSFFPTNPIENEDEVVFKNKSSGDYLSNFTWSFNDNSVHTFNTKNASYLYTLPGTFQVALVVRNEFNCADTVVKSLNVEPDFSFYIPNAFTPDGDGKNDYFSAVLRSTKFFSLKIYNRWGIELFYTTDSSEGWNGKSNGSECPADSYSWQIELTTANGQKKQLSGMVVLIR